MNIGEVIRLVNWTGSPHNGNIGIIVDKTFEHRPPGNHKILVYKVLVGGIIINVPLNSLVRINTHPATTGDTQ